MHVAIVVYDGFDDLDAIGPFEVFSHAKHCGADLEVGLYTMPRRSRWRRTTGSVSNPTARFPPIRSS